MLAKVTKDEPGKGEDKEEAAGNCIEFPVLPKDIADTRLKQVSKATNDEIKDDQFKQTQP